MDAKEFSCFGDADLAQICDAVVEAERQTSGEIVTVIADASDDYPDALWRAAAVGICVGVAVAIAFAVVRRDWAFDPLMYGAVPVIGGAALGAILATVFPSVRRLLAGSDTIEARVHDAAEAAFLEEAVFDTTERSGVLIYVTLFERRAVVLADEGVHTRVPEGAWSGVVEELCRSMHMGEALSGVIDAVESCGEILRDHALGRRSDDEDELGNEPRLRSR